MDQRTKEQFRDEDGLWEIERDMDGSEIVRHVIEPTELFRQKLRDRERQTHISRLQGVVDRIDALARTTSLKEVRDAVVELLKVRYDYDRAKAIVDGDGPGTNPRSR